MIYFLATMLFIAAWLLCDMLNDEVKQNKVERKRKFAIPPEFWDDYNKCLFFIDRMSINEVSKTQYMVDDIIFKYHECLDYITFTERISILIDKIESKKRTFFIIDSLN
jgi:hypothetical protein